MARDFRGAMASPGDDTSPRLAIACVADTKTKYLFEAFRLAQALSLNTEFKGFADLYIGVFPDAQRDFSDFVGLYRGLGARIVTLGERSEDHGPSNKLQILDAPELTCYDHVALVDCDMLPVRPFPEVLDFDGVQAKIADSNTLDRSQLSGVFGLLGLPMPASGWQTSLDRVAHTCYCNTGCIIFSRSILDEFVTRWRRFNDVLRANKSVLGERVFFLDQASFCACLSTFLDRFRPLPISMNFPGHFPVEHYPDDTLSVEPQWLHYHNKVDRRTGALDLTTLPNVQKTVDAFNGQSAPILRALRETPMFWQVYYGAHTEQNPIGDRHPEAHALVRCAIDSLKAESILDLGCGTFSPRELDPSIAYHGIDWSAEAIKRARRRFPRYSYSLGNIRDAKAPAKADLVMMLDVIGPEGSSRDKALLARVLTWANRAVLVSASAPAPDTREEAWKIFLDWLATVSPGFREVGHVGSELFVLRTQ